MKMIVKCIACVGIVTLGLFGLGLTIERSTNVRRDVGSYEQYLADFRPTRLCEHFPTKLPKSIDASVAYSTGPLQAFAFLQLRLHLPSESVVEIKELAEPQAIAKYSGGNMFTHYNMDHQKNFPTTSFYTNPDDSQDHDSFPDHYTMYIFSAHQNGSDWETTGIAISSNNNEVVYWGQDD